MLARPWLAAGGVPGPGDEQDDGQRRAAAAAGAPVPGCGRRCRGAPPAGRGWQDRGSPWRASPRRRRRRTAPASAGRARRERGAGRRSAAASPKASVMSTRAAVAARSHSKLVSSTTPAASAGGGAVRLRHRGGQQQRRRARTAAPTASARWPRRPRRAHGRRLPPASRRAAVCAAARRRCGAAGSSRRAGTRSCTTTASRGSPRVWNGARPSPARLQHCPRERDRRTTRSAGRPHPSGAPTPAPLSLISSTARCTTFRAMNSNGARPPHAARGRLRRRRRGESVLPAFAPYDAVARARARSLRCCCCSAPPAAGRHDGARRASSCASPTGVARRHWPLTVSVPFAARRAAGERHAVHVADEHGRRAADPDALAGALAGRLGALAAGRHAGRPARPARSAVCASQPGAPPGIAAPSAVTDGATIASRSTPARCASQSRSTLRHPRRRAASPDRRPPVLDAIALDAGRRRAQRRGAGAAERHRYRERTAARPHRAARHVTATTSTTSSASTPTPASRFVRVWHTFIDRHPTPYVSLPSPLGRAAARRAEARGATASAWSAAGRAARRSGRRRRAALPDRQHRLAVDRRPQRRAAGRLGRARQRRAPGRRRGALVLAGVSAEHCRAHRDALIYNLWAPEADPAKAGVGAAKTHEFVLWLAPPRGLAAGASARPGASRWSASSIPPGSRAAGRCRRRSRRTGGGRRFARKAVEAAQRYLQPQRSRALERLRRGPLHRAPAASGRASAPTACGTGATGTSAATRTAPRAPTAGATSSTTRRRCWRWPTPPAASRDLFDAMVAAARHFIDVDTIHA